MVEDSKTYRAIYKVDNKKVVRVFYVERYGATYDIFTGLVDNPTNSHSNTVTEGKNLGKANATTAVEQAHKEVEARYRKKLASGYCTTPEEAIALNNTGGAFFMPMLAYERGKYKTNKLLNTTDWMFDVKLDGMRMTVSTSHCLSRRGKELPAAKFIADVLQDFLSENYPSITLDGELYNHAFKDDFEALMSLCRKKTLNKDQYEEVKEKLQYHIYDIYDSENPDMTAIDRKIFIANNIMPHFLGQNSSIQFVMPLVIKDLPEYNTLSWDDLTKKLHDEFVTVKGYEGVIGRVMNSKYENKRTWNLMKIKLFFDEEFTILGFNEEVNKEGVSMAASANVKTKDGVLCKPAVKGSEEQAIKLWKERANLIGMEATVKHFGYTKYGSLRHPNIKDIDRWNYE